MLGLHWVTWYYVFGVILFDDVYCWSFGVRVLFVVLVCLFFFVWFYLISLLVCLLVLFVDLCWFCFLSFGLIVLNLLVYVGLNLVGWLLRLTSLVFCVCGFGLFALNCWFMLFWCCFCFVCGWDYLLVVWCLVLLCILRC